MIDKSIVKEICWLPDILASLASEKVTYEGEGKDPIESLKTLSVCSAELTRREISQ